MIDFYAFLDLGSSQSAYRKGSGPDILIKICVHNNFQEGKSKFKKLKSQKTPTRMNG